MIGRRGWLTVLAAGLTAACSPSPPPSVLLVSVESLRADSLSTKAETAPRMSELAGESVTFTHAVSSAPWTTPSLMALQTGLLPAAHGVDQHDRALSPEVDTLAGRFGEAGYHTAAITPAITLRPEFGFDRGFEVYDIEMYGHDLVSSPALVSRVMQQMDEAGEAPFFIWVHLWDPHYNYVPPAPYDDAFRRGEKPEREDVQCLKWFEDAVTPAEAEYLHGQYDGEVAYTDEYLGRLLDDLQERGLAEDTIVAVVSDHGEAFLEHGWLGHTNRLDEVLVHVPMMLRWTGHLEPAEIERPVSTASLGRTLLELAGLDPKGFGMLESLPLSPVESASSEGKQQPWDGRVALSETRRRGCFTSMTGADLKYVVDHRSCQEQLYDLSVDPNEQQDLAADSPDLLEQARVRLRQELDRVEALNIPSTSLPGDIQRDSQDRLAALGYIQVEEDEKEPVAERVHRCAPPGADPTDRDSFGDVLVDTACPEDWFERCL